MGEEGDLPRHATQPPPPQQPHWSGMQGHPEATLIAPPRAVWSSPVPVGRPSRWALNQGALRSSGCSRQSLDPGQHRSPEARTPTYLPPRRTDSPQAHPPRAARGGWACGLARVSQGMLQPGEQHAIRQAWPGNRTLPASVSPSLQWEYESHPCPLWPPGGFKEAPGRGHS